MKLTEITLPARDPHAVARDWSVLLDVPSAADDDGTATVTVGWSSVRWVPDPAFAGSHHLAVTVPDDVFEQGKAWIAGRTPLLTGDGGADEFEAAPAWNARNLYFAGPEESVLELIARRDRDDPADGPFAPEHLRGISEVGVAVDTTVTDVADRLAAIGLPAYANPVEESFGAVGDVDGLLILVTPGRPWFPTPDRTAAAVPTSIIASAPTVTGTHRLAARATVSFTG